jgi:hypothetical protein
MLECSDDREPGSYAVSESGYRFASAIANMDTHRRAWPVNPPKENGARRTTISNVSCIASQESNGDQQRASWLAA